MLYCQFIVMARIGSTKLENGAITNEQPMADYDYTGDINYHFLKIDLNLLRPYFELFFLVKYNGRYGSRLSLKVFSIFCVFLARGVGRLQAFLPYFIT